MSIWTGVASARDADGYSKQPGLRPVLAFHGLVLFLSRVWGDCRKASAILREAGHLKGESGSSFFTGHVANYTIAPFPSARGAGSCLPLHRVQQ